VTVILFCLSFEVQDKLMWNLRFSRRWIWKLLASGCDVILFCRWVCQTGS